MRPSWLQDGCRPPKRKNRWRSPISIMFHERMGAKIQVFLVKFLFIPNPKSRPKSRPLIHQIWRGSMAGSSRKSVLLGIGTQKKNTTCTSFLGLSTGENPKKKRWNDGLQIVLGQMGQHLADFCLVVGWADLRCNPIDGSENGSCATPAVCIPVILSSTTHV